MKTKLYCTFLGSFMFFVSASSQQDPEIKPLFIRVYNGQGVKISKGRLLSINEEGLVLQRGRNTDTIATADIARIKTKRALGRAMGIGAILGGTAGAIAGANSGSSLDNLFTDFGASESTNFDTAGLFSFGLIGAAIGTGAGALSGVFNKPNAFEIQGQESQLLNFKAAVQKGDR